MTPIDVSYRLGKIKWEERIEVGGRSLKLSQLSPMRLKKDPQIAIFT